MKNACSLIGLICTAVVVGTCSALKSRKEVLEEIMKGYDPKIPPNYEDNKPTTVTVQIYLASVDSISETSMDFNVVLFLRQTWYDKRLKYDGMGKIKFLELDVKSMTGIWVPDVYFSNEKEGSFFDITIPNRLMHIFPEGRVYYSLRLTLKLSCFMHLQKYPFDSQECPIKLESYGYTTDNIIIQFDGTPIVQPKVLHMPQFNLETYTTQDCTQAYGESNFTCVRADLHISRDYGYHITQIYLPSTLVVILSWVSFWLDIDAIPARISLGLLTVLTMSTQSAGVRSTLPRVSYIKAIDIWMAVCLFFVFAALIEFAYVNVHARVEKRRMTSYAGSQTKPKPEESDDVAARSTAKTVKERQKARAVDKIARFAFPGVFILFNLLYWVVYFTWNPSISDLD